MNKLQSLEKLNPKTHQIEGVYGDKIIKINTFKLPNNNKIVINIHGTFGSMNGGNNKYLNFAQNLQDGEVANVVLYESSRKNIEIDSSLTDRYKQKQAKFIGKTFSNELEDARRVIKDTINRSKELFGINNNELEITLNGNSLGGILAFYLAYEFPQVKNIVSVGTGLRLEIKDVPILNTFPDATEIIQKLQTFSGKFLMLYGSEDDVFTPEAFESFYKNVGTQDKSFLHMLGVDHTFGKISGETSPHPYKQVSHLLEVLLNTGELVSGELNLKNNFQKNISQTSFIVNGVLIDKYFSQDK